MADAPASARRVLILAPGGGNATIARRVLTQAGLECEVCADMTALGHAIGAGAGAVLITVEALTPPALETLQRLLSLQPAWSALPLIILNGGRGRSRLQPSPHDLFRTLRGAIVLERPVRPVTLVSVIDSALDARDRQCQVRDLLARQAQDVRHRDQFLAMLGHELRNPLAPIRNLLEVFRLRAGDLPEDLRGNVEVMSRQALHLTHLINELLDVARVTQGHISLHKAPVDLVNIIEEAGAQAEPLIQARRHHLRLELPRHPLRIEGDAERLVQVISNLLNNAAKYTGTGGDIQVTANRQGDEVVLQVRDNGQGIAPELLPRLFEAFVQAEESPEHAASGLGLGLALVRQLVELHGGWVEAHSPGRGRGSEFVVHLPALAEPKPTAVAPTEADQPTGRRRILVVDDERAVANALSELFRALGHEVRTSYGGREALEMAQDWQPEIVFVDLRIPEMSGFEVARRLRSVHGQALRLIALSGYDQETQLRQGRAADFDAHLMKPVDVADLQVLLAKEN